MPNGGVDANLYLVNYSSKKGKFRNRGDRCVFFTLAQRVIRLGVFWCGVSPISQPGLIDHPSCWLMSTLHLSPEEAIACLIFKLIRNKLLGAKLRELRNGFRNFSEYSFSILDSIVVCLCFHFSTHSCQFYFFVTSFQVSSFQYTNYC